MTNWFFSWPVIVFWILLVCVCRIILDRAERRARDRDE